MTAVEIGVEQKLVESDMIVNSTDSHDVNCVRPQSVTRKESHLIAEHILLPAVGASLLTEIHHLRLISIDTYLYPQRPVADRMSGNKGCHELNLTG